MCRPSPQPGGVCPSWVGGLTMKGLTAGGEGMGSPGGTQRRGKHAEDYKAQSRR